MSGFFTSIFQWISGLFFSKQAEIAVVGLQASGKTSFVNVITSGQWSEDVVPTVAFNFRKIRKGNVTMKIWDVAGQPKFRSMWERYCNGVDAIVFVVDSLDHDKFNTARFELHQLLSQPTLTGVPLLVLGNKNDLPGHASVKELIKGLCVPKGHYQALYPADTLQSTGQNLRPPSFFPPASENYSAVLFGRGENTVREFPSNFSTLEQCSMKSQHNLDIVLQWLAGRSH
ncbi:hypothetical protein CVT26_000807 [Gymnopilus dilepis]|uniref:P-loop containing nucleoside triphosphate hydrolase protein n=1 Tax=Gymnopilus dilepis TaxID=231916 RepID=A0A409VI22_9AGAR|nr:hypothetical protein CVT26_000807 [Gymnopilus dilepis]